MGLVIEAKRKIEFLAIGAPPSLTFLDKLIFLVFALVCVTNAERSLM